MAGLLRVLEEVPLFKREEYAFKGTEPSLPNIKTSTISSPLPIHRSSDKLDELAKKKKIPGDVSFPARAERFPDGLFTRVHIGVPKPMPKEVEEDLIEHMHRTHLTPKATLSSKNPLLLLDAHSASHDLHGNLLNKAILEIRTKLPINPKDDIWLHQTGITDAIMKSAQFTTEEKNLAELLDRDLLRLWYSARVGSVTSATSSASGMAATSSASGLTATAGASGMTATSSASGMVATSSASGMTATSSASGVAATSSASGLTATAGASGMAATSSVPAASTT
eukprot:TRINITY_DN41029_c0_g2_i2.p1 TRINITY_DN41029_c0_g2~~TRINITY_DN41029_c0_g2_i2.p1  ORF type:complete len:316 (-),score=-0.19 TRINITY_DN41029_c0_g2_i2:52-897(-)